MLRATRRDEATRLSMLVQVKSSMHRYYELVRPVVESVIAKHKLLGWIPGMAKGY